MADEIQDDPRPAGTPEPPAPDTVLATPESAPAIPNGKKKKKKLLTIAAVGLFGVIIVVAALPKFMKKAPPAAAPVPVTAAAPVEQVAAPTDDSLVVAAADAAKEESAASTSATTAETKDAKAEPKKIEPAKAEEKKEPVKAEPKAEVKVEVEKKEWEPAPAKIPFFVVTKRKSAISDQKAYEKVMASPYTRGDTFAVHDFTRTKPKAQIHDFSTKWGPIITQTKGT